MIGCNVATSWYHQTCLLCLMALLTQEIMIELGWSNISETAWTTMSRAFIDFKLQILRKSNQYPCFRIWRQWTHRQTEFIHHDKFLITIFKNVIRFGWNHQSWHWTMTSKHLETSKFDLLWACLLIINCY